MTTDLPTDRRAFLRGGMLALAACGAPLRGWGAEDPAPWRLKAGIAGPLAKADLLKQAGAEFLTVGTGDLLVPDQPEAAFATRLAEARAAALPVLACNGFIRPAHLRCVGPEANPDAVLAWAEVAFQRLAKVGASFMVFGSAGARRLPEGWSRDRAEEQFVDVLKRMGPLAEQAGITLVVEQLQASECNFINRIGHAASLIRRAGHPRVRLLADLFHMARGGDTPGDLKAAMDVVVHVEIAEKRDRSYPGVDGDDFRPFFRVLRAAGYRGAVNIEGKGGEGQLAAAFHEIARQVKEAV